MVNLSHDIPPLRDYQRVLNESIDEALKEHKGIILQMPTGTGKGNIIITRTINALKTGKSVLIVVPNQYLVDNIGKRLKEFAPKYYNAFYQPIMTGTEKIYDTGITVGVYKSISQAIKKGDIKPDQYSTVIHDEVHHLRSETWFSIGNFLQAKHEGYTATPERLDGKKLGGDVFQHLIKSPSVDWFIDSKYLSPYDLMTTAKIDLSDSRSFNDALDLQQKLLDNKAQIGNAIDTWEKTAYGKKTVIYCTGCDHADHIAQQFNERFKDKLVNGKKIDFRSIHSKKTDRERRESLRLFNEGKITGLVNIDMLTEGVDVPDIEVVCLLRFTYSLSLYLQMVGRGLRYIPNKRLLILDHVGNALEHGSPSFDHDWDIHRSKVRNSQYNNNCECYYCKMPLITKQKVTRYGGEGIRIKCPNCDYMNHFIMETVKRFRDTNKIPGNMILEGSLVQFTSDQDTLKIYKIMAATKKTVQQKITAIIDLPNVKDSAKKDALALLGLNDSTIEMYLS